MFMVGLTGGFGSGKSTVAQTLQDLGATVIGADTLAREVCAPGTDGLAEIISTFGRDVLFDDGSLDRKRLGDVVFSDPASLSKLNSIVHPRIIAREGELIQEMERAQKDTLVVLDVPLLIEVERHHQVDYLVVVDAPMMQRFERLKAKFGDLDRVALEARMKNQLPLEEKVKLADFVVDNSGSLEDTRLQVERLFEQLKQMAADHMPSDS
ncbi:dephospho-CoA kinase [bacterium]|nr:dephospho-CoA kinase [bacterium]